MSEPAPLDFGRGVAVAGWALAIHYAVALTAIEYDAPSPWPTALSAVATVVVVVAGIGGPARAARAGFRRPPARFVIAAVLYGATAGFALAGFNHFVGALFVPASHHEGPDAALWSTLGLAVVVAPLGEELLFRGALLRGLAARWSWPRAIATSAIAFALFHHSPYHLVIPFVGGAVTGYFTLKSGSIVPAIVAHALNNLVIELELAHAPSGWWSWVHEHHDALLGPAAIIAFTAVVISATGAPASRSEASTDPSVPAASADPRT